MQTKISVLFHLKRSKSTSTGLIPIYMRVTVNGQRIEISTKRSVQEERWSIDAGRIKGNTAETRSINEYLDLLKNQVFNYQSELMHLGQPVNFDNLRNKLLGKETKKHSLVSIFEEHNKQMKALLGKEFAPGTLLADKIGMDKSNLIATSKDRFNVTALTILKISKALEVDPKEFFK